LKLSRLGRVSCGYKKAVEVTCEHGSTDDEDEGCLMGPSG
jgi:hypothetical protein